MSLLLTSLLYVAVGCVEWYLATRRALAVVRGETATLCTITFVENLLGLFVLSNFIKTGSWIIAIAYSLGGSLGCFCVMESGRKKKESG